MIRPSSQGKAAVSAWRGLLRCAADPALRTMLRLDASSRVFLINTEGATDPDLYAELVGLAPANVAAGTQ